MRFAKVGDRFGKSVTLDVDSIRSFARACGDTNPLHHDEAVARASRFGSIIACGPHTASLLLALSAEHFARICPALGLDSACSFARP
jgi:acyl dehydratase